MSQSTRKLAMVVRRFRRGDPAQDAEARAYWATRTPSERLSAVIEMRADAVMDPTGSAQQGIARVVFRRRRGEPPIGRPPGDENTAEA